MPKDTEPGQFKASDLMELAGLTYRQLNDWENRAGVLAPERATDDGWRKFTGQEVLALSICAGLRRQLATPLSRIGQVYLWMLGRKPDKVCSLLAEIAEITLSNMEANEKITRLVSLRGDELKQALKNPANAYVVNEFIGAKLNALARTPLVLAVKLASMGMPVYLCTTFDSSMILQERNLVRWVAMRAAHEPTIIFPLNDVINGLLERTGRQALGLDTHMQSFMEYWAKLQEQADVTISEREALRLIREHAYQRVTVHVAGGEIVQVDTQEEIQTGSDTVKEQAIIELIKKNAYQTVEIVVKNHEIVVLHSKRITKVPSGRGKNPNR